MKRKLFLLTLVMTCLVFVSNAQHVSVRLNFPVGAHYRAPGPPPFSGSIWIGPEWSWRGGRYEYVPGYWARPMRPGMRWIPGHWRYARHGYVWVPGHWR